MARLNACLPARPRLSRASQRPLRKIQNASCRDRDEHFPFLRNRDFRFGRPDQDPYTPIASPHGQFLRRTFSQSPSLSPRWNWSPRFQGIFPTPLRPCSVSSPDVFGQRSHAILLGSAQILRSMSAGDLDALLPAGASSTAQASPAGPRFSPAAAGNLSGDAFGRTPVDTPGSWPCADGSVVASLVIELGSARRARSTSPASVTYPYRQLGTGEVGRKSDAWDKAEMEYQPSVGTLLTPY